MSTGSVDAVSTSAIGLARVVRIVMGIEILRDSVVKRANDTHEHQNLASEHMSHVMFTPMPWAIGHRVGGC